MTPRTAIGLIFTLSVVTASAQAADEAPPFVRRPPDARALQTALRIYVHPAKASVTIISTVHVGTREYYRDLSAKLAGFDCVLIEGVRRRPADAARVATYDYAKDLGLVQQTRALDLRQASNLINADLDGDAFDRIRTATVASNAPSNVSPSSRQELSSSLLLLATDHATLAATETAFALRARHDVVLQALRHRLARGDASIALVYGVAHGPDLHVRLLKLGFAEQSTEWIDAFPTE